ncbi:MAG: CBS domain-containing protein [Bacteroidetes bacterium]|nr:CBS domain-containing protein [Bacteroidota bacterium]
MNLNIPISDVMTKDVVSITPSQKLIDVKHIFERQLFHHHIPVTENGKLTGMISLVDFLFAIKTASLDDEEKVYHNLFVKDIMRESPVSRQPSSTFKQVSEELAKGEIHAIAITDNDGYLKGIVSTADIIRYFLKHA